jgi:MoaA/NifB/PqqE/SkfB family radical SAM enzyme
MDKIRIVNWLLTRRCNLRCDYCGIIRDVSSHSLKKSINYFIKNEMECDYVIRVLKMFKLHNPDCFHIFYGGEPFLRDDLSEIIEFCNKEGIHYTIITNNTDEIQNRIEDLISKHKVMGLTSSVDPGIFVYTDERDHEFKKSLEGFKNLIKYKEFVPDVVAEITITNDTVGYLYRLVETLSKSGITSSITALDINKSEYYDFSNITDTKQLVHRSDELTKQFNKIRDNLDLRVHMKEILPKLWEILPSNLDCKLEDGLHNITIDADGSVRLCLRIGGKYTPTHVMAHSLFARNTNCKLISPFALLCIHKDKKELCKLCNHTCQIMSMCDNVEDIVHLNIRREN